MVATDTERFRLRRFIERLVQRADRTRRDPESLLAELRRELTQSDLRVVDDAAMRRLITDTYAEAVRFGADGWIDDALAFRRDWGFRLEDITVPVQVWQGDTDRNVPVAHAERQAAAIPRAVLHLVPGEGHVMFVDHFEEILGGLLNSRT